MEFINWDVDEPDEEDVSKECVEMNQLNGKWAVRECSATRNWICKIRMGEL